MNTVNVIGRLVADPELRYTAGGVAVVTVTIAVDRRFKTEGGEKQTDFFDVVAWRHSAEYASNYLVKGQRVGVTGRLQQRTWVQQDGQKRSKVEIVAEYIQGLDRPAGAPAPTAAVTEPDADSAGDYDPMAEE